MVETLATEIAGHMSRMYRVALRIVGSADVAQEVAQDACVKALRGTDAFDGRSALAAWLHRIAVNCATKGARTARRWMADGFCSIRPRRRSRPASGRCWRRR